jgi:hypothetical protein
MVAFSSSWMLFKPRGPIGAMITLKAGSGFDMESIEAVLIYFISMHCKYLHLWEQIPIRDSVAA